MNIENRMVIAEPDYEYYERMQKEAEERLAWEEDNYDYWEEREKEECEWWYEDLNARELDIPCEEDME